MNATSTTILGLVNGHTTSISNLNATSTTILGLDNGHTTSMSNLNATSTSIFNNLNSLSGQSFFLTNYTNLNNLNVSGTTILNAGTTFITWSTLNVSGNTQLNNCTNNGYCASNSSFAGPVIGINGGLGSKYVLYRIIYPGSGSTFPYSLGINALGIQHQILQVIAGILVATH